MFSGTSVLKKHLVTAQGAIKSLKLLLVWEKKRSHLREHLRSKFVKSKPNDAAITQFKGILPLRRRSWFYTCRRRISCDTHVSKKHLCDDNSCSINQHYMENVEHQFVLNWAKCVLWAPFWSIHGLNARLLCRLGWFFAPNSSCLEVKSGVSAITWLWLETSAKTLELLITG